MNHLYLRVLGNADWHATAHNDNSCYLLNDRVLIDACPTALMQMLNAGIDPLSVDTICMTHLHSDHAMGLAALLQYWFVRMSEQGRGNGDFRDLTIVGPKASLEKSVELVLRFVTDCCAFAEERPLNVTAMPKLIPLEGNAETSHPQYRVRVMNSDHAVPGLCYRFEHIETGKTVGFTGDTKYLPAFASFFKDVDLLVHEASFGEGPVPEWANTSCKHSSAVEAVRVCRECGAKQLLLTHCYEPKRAAAIRYIKENLSIPASWATAGSVFEY